MKSVTTAYELAKSQYAQIGVDTDKALEILDLIPISLQCWQGDNMVGFECDPKLAHNSESEKKAYSAPQLRQDLEKAFSLIPGKHRVNLHSIYLDTNEYIPRDEIGPEQYKTWVEWAKLNTSGLDFNASMFAHEMADTGFTLSSNDKGIRYYWIEHCKRCRKIGEYFGKELKTPCVTNIFTIDGSKSVPIDRFTPRKLLKTSLDEIFSETIDKKCNLDSIECKSFGFNTQNYTVASEEFCSGYAQNNGIILGVDSSPLGSCQSISSKISSNSIFIDRIMLHISRPVKWNNNNVVILDDELREISNQIVRGNLLNKVHFALDFYDNTVDKVAAWVIGTRAMQKALLLSLLEPTQVLKQCEASKDYTSKIALIEEFKSYPFGAVWDYYSFSQGVPVGIKWLEELKKYNNDDTNKYKH